MCHSLLVVSTEKGDIYQEITIRWILKKMCGATSSTVTVAKATAIYTKSLKHSDVATFQIGGSESK